MGAQREQERVGTEIISRCTSMQIGLQKKRQGEIAVHMLQGAKQAPKISRSGR